VNANATETETIGWNDPRWAEASITARQADYWTRNEYLHAIDPAPSSGTSRQWPVEELEVAIRVKRLLDVGFLLGTAFVIARFGFGAHEIGEGIFIEVAP
jgi:hypothetical protein